MGDSQADWQASGSYFEVCNCDAPCICRRIGGRPGENFQYETCDFALTWHIDDGHFGTASLKGLNVAMAGRWADAKPPWEVMLYVDERADAAQRQALEAIFLGRAGGSTAENYGRAIGEVHAVHAARIELDHARGREHVRIGTRMEVDTSHVLAMQESVSCGIPGHDHPGDELVAQRMRVNDGVFQWRVEGKCGFATEFDYRSG